MAGDRPGEATVLTSLGETYRQAEQFGQAISALQDAVLIYRDVGDTDGEDVAIASLDAVRQAQLSAHADPI
jgi:hypothetical protein